MKLPEINEHEFQGLEFTTITNGGDNAHLENEKPHKSSTNQPKVR